MAIKDVRINFYLDDEEASRQFNLEIGQPFTWYMEALLRGRFKQYSGNEVKGINIVNLNLIETNRYKQMNIRSGGQLKKEWIVLLNTYEFETDFDPAIFKGNRTDKLSKAIEVFLEYAKLSNLPQMEKIVEHLHNSIGIQSLQDAIKKADECYQQLHNEQK